MPSPRDDSSSTRDDGRGPSETDRISRGDPASDGNPSTSVGSDGDRSTTSGTSTAGPTREGKTAGSGPPPRHRSAETSEPARLKRFGLYLFDIVSSIFVVIAIGGFLFAASGVWPPLVAIESGSMEPHIDKGDLVFVMEEQRFPGAGANGDSGVVTAAMGVETEYRSFDGHGDVIVYEPYGNGEAVPIIHRAMFWVEEGENWYQRADPAYLGNADDCSELSNCPAPHAGFITKGDNNEFYDQGRGISNPVKPAWVVGTAEVRVPFLGEIRLSTNRATSSNASIVP